MNRQCQTKGRLERYRVLAVAMTLLLSSYCADAQTSDKVRLGVSDVSFTFLPHLIAKETGIFQKRGLQVEVIFIGGPVGTAALAAESSIIARRRIPGLPAAVQGVPIKAVLFAMKGPPFYLISQPGLKKINEPAGKKVGLSRLGTSPYYASRRIFRKFGVDAEKITYIQAGSNMNRVMRSNQWILGCVHAVAANRADHDREGIYRIGFSSGYRPCAPRGFNRPDRYHREKSGAGEKNDRIARSRPWSTWRNNKAKTIDYIIANGNSIANLPSSSSLAIFFRC